jgi:hypothetical protein
MTKNTQARLEPPNFGMTSRVFYHSATATYIIKLGQKMRKRSFFNFKIQKSCFKRFGLASMRFEILKREKKMEKSKFGKKCKKNFSKCKFVFIQSKVAK